MLDSECVLWYASGKIMMEEGEDNGKHTEKLEESRIEEMNARYNALQTLCETINKLDIPDILRDYIMLVTYYYFHCVETQEMLDKMGCLK